MEKNNKHDQGNRRSEQKEKVSVKSMEITNRVKASQEATMASTSKSGFDYTSLGKKGQVIEGTIVGVSDKISINFSGKEMNISKSAVRDAKEGEIRKFEIMDISNTGIVLKEVESEETIPGNQGVLTTKVETDATTFQENLERSVKEESKEETTEDLEAVSNRMTGEDYKSIEQEGISIETYNLERLERVLKRIKEQRSFKAEHFEKNIKSQKEDQEQVEKIVLHNVVSSVVSGAMAQQIAKKLEGANLPVTAENIKKIANTVELASISTKLSDKAMAYMIENELAPTVENIYHAQYAGNSQKYQDYIPNYGDGFSNDSITYDVDAAGQNNMVKEENWNKIQPQVEELLRNVGMESEERTTALKQAKWLYFNDLPITEESLNQLEQLEELKTGYNQDAILEEIVGVYAKGEAAEHASLAIGTIERANQKVEIFLAEIEAALSQAVVLEEPEVVIDIESITTRRQMEEIRLKMTLDAGRQLIKQGITLDTKNLEEVVEGLRNIEEQYYKGLLQEQEVPVSIENIALLRETTETVEQLKEAPSYILGMTLEQRDSMDLTTLHREAVSLKVQLDKAETTYEALMTKPDREYGDSLQKAFANVDHILEEMGLEVTQSNQRAVRILGYNSMPITEENINEVKCYDAQVNAVLTKLPPAVTVAMIKQGMNPLDMPIEELNQQIVDMKEEMGITEEEKYSKYLWQLEKEDGITPEERKAYIGIYRLLHNVQKTDGAAVGHLLQADKAITLNNLLSAVRTIKSGGVEEKIDDAFGALEQIEYARETITQQIESVFTGEERKEQNQQSKEQYTNQIVAELLEEISPQVLEKIMENQAALQKPSTEGDKQKAHEIPREQWGALLDKTVEKLIEEIRTEQETTNVEYEEEVLEQIRKLAGQSEAVIDFLNDYRVPVNVKNIFAANQLLSDYSLFRTIKAKAAELPEEERLEIELEIESFADGLEDAQTMQEKYNALEYKVENMLNKAYKKQEITSKDIKALRLFSNTITLAKTLSKEQSYEIPIVTDERITNIKLTIVSDTKDTGKIQIKMHSEKLGKMNAEFVLKENELKGFLLCDTKEGLENIKKGEGEFESRLEQQGITIKQINYGIETKSMDAYKKQNNKDNEVVDTKALYQAAKAFVQTISVLERT